MAMCPQLLPSARCKANETASLPSNGDISPSLVSRHMEANYDARQTLSASVQTSAFRNGLDGLHVE